MANYKIKDLQPAASLNSGVAFEIQDGDNKSTYTTLSQIKAFLMNSTPVVLIMKSDDNGGYVPNMAASAIRNAYNSIVGNPLLYTPVVRIPDNGGQYLVPAGYGVDTTSNNVVGYYVSDTYVLPYVLTLTAETFSLEGTDDVASNMKWADMLNNCAIPFEYLTLDNDSSSEEISDAVGGADSFHSMCLKLMRRNTVAVYSGNPLMANTGSSVTANVKVIVSPMIPHDYTLTLEYVSSGLYKILVISEKNGTFSATKTQVSISGIPEALSGKADKAVPAVAGNLAGLTASGNLQDSGVALDEVARLDDNGELLPSQIAPLQGRQTGVNTSNGFFMSEDPALLFEGSRTHEICFTTGEDVQTFSCLISTRNDDLIGWNVLLYISGGAVRACAGGRCIAKGPSVQPNTTYHVVLSVDADYTKADMYVNGGIAASISSFSDYQNPNVYLVGTLNYLNGSYPFKGVIHYHRLFNYALSAYDAALLWNNGDPTGYMLPSSWKCPALDFPTSVYTASRNTYASNQQNVVSTMTYDVPAANGFSGMFMRNEAIQNVSMYCNYRRDRYRDIPTKITMEYRSNCDLYTAQINGQLLLSANEAEAKVATIIYSPDGTPGYMFGVPQSPDLWAEMRILSIESVGCVAEYLPCGLLADRWRDTAGHGPDLAAGDTPYLSYQRMPDQREIVVDSGMFYTNISAGTAGKSIPVPAGYAVSQLSVFNGNSETLTGVSVALNGISLISDQSVTAASPLLVVPSVAVTYNKSDNALTVNATGNTSSGGMRIRAVCKWIGF